jgi:alpha-1,3-rhamnosyl/mannosyltransferase
VERLKLDPQRVSMVHQSVGSRFRPVPRADAEPVLAGHGLSWGGYVLYVGAIDSRKNLERLVKAFLRLAGDGLLLALVGSETVRGHSSQVREAANRSERVKFLGHVPDGMLPSLYSGARCFAFPSLAEGFGRPCVEAMACGAPVVASSATALPETCGEAALLPDPESEEAIAEALQTACFSEAERSRLVEAGRRRAGEFSPDRFAADLLKAFEAALAGPREGLWPA